VKTTYNSTRAYIFDTLPADDNPVTGTKFSANSFGLYGLTGSIAWADKDKNVTIVVLSNSAYANGVDKFRSISGQLLDIIMTILGY
jgi:CubicO group peptidase (beta-lactamase class C family)